jgi:hypothetical protein
MQSQNEAELHVSPITVTWSACELCGSIGPSFTTRTRNQREYVQRLHSKCCGVSAKNTEMRAR